MSRKPAGKNIAWLAEVKDYGPSLDYLQPVWFEERTVSASEAMPPPHSHRYFEFGILIEGSVKMSIGAEERIRRTEDLFIAGPAMPHTGRGLSFPLRYYVVYFQPWILLESGTKDALLILERFVAGQPIDHYLVSLTKPLRHEFLQAFHTIKKETENRAFGWKLEIQAMIIHLLVRLLRIEMDRGWRNSQASSFPSDWKVLQKTLNSIHARFAEPLYGRKLAEAAGVSESRLQALFRTLLGMSWVHYLQHYRIQRAAALLTNPSVTITEAAFAVGYESLSHFNATFHALTGMSPSRYRKTQFPSA